MSKVIIFGTNDFAQLAHFYLTLDSEHEIVAFTVNKNFKIQDEFMGLPVVEFDEIENFFIPSDYNLFIPISPSKMNANRTRLYLEAKDKGYKCISYISPKSTYYGTPVGENCFIFENNVIQPFTHIGNNVILWSGNHIGHHSTIGDNCFIASHVVISGHVSVHSNCFIGVNATVSNNLIIAENTFIGAGALITANTEPNSVYPGIKAEVSKIPSSKLKF
jgi:sugar O-acyltransferase (sialic acid O-acetyltransferase NeuD family)